MQLNILFSTAALNVSLAQRLRPCTHSTGLQERRQARLVYFQVLETIEKVLGANNTAAANTRVRLAQILTETKFGTWH